MSYLLVLISLPVWLVDSLICLLDFQTQGFESRVFLFIYVIQILYPLRAKRDSLHVPICVFVHMFVYWFLFHVRKLSQHRGKHTEGRCVNSSCSTLPSSKGKFVSLRESTDLNVLIFWAERNFSHNRKWYEFDLKARNNETSGKLESQSTCDVT